MHPNSEVIHAQCRKELASQQEYYETHLFALTRQRIQLRREKDKITHQRNTENVRHNKRVLDLTQEIHKLSGQLEAEARELQRSQREKDSLLSELYKVRIGLEQLER